jgi:kanosamine-6-phosphate phosphatase
MALPSSSRSLPVPSTVRCAAFADFDETYLAHAATAEQRRCLTELEGFLLEQSERSGLLFGWVTGSSVASVMSKVTRYRLGPLPHLLAASLGTELVFFRHGRAERDPVWAERMGPVAAFRKRATQLVGQLSQHGLSLVTQGTRGDSELVASYYYRSQSVVQDTRALRLMRSLAAEHGLGLNLSRCNPRAGDPADCFDVDLIPANGGKANVVRHVCAQLGLGPSRTFAFGDSGNDLEMLTSVGHGWLVSNCTAEARARHPRVSEHAYAAAILACLREHLSQPSGWSQDAP